MNPQPPIPSKADFLQWNPEQVAQVAPTSVYIAFGGTRRWAALEGIAAEDITTYMNKGFAEMLRVLHLLFNEGVEHIFTTAGIGESHQKEGSQVWKNFFQSMIRQLTSDSFIKFCQAEQWRVKLLGAFEGTRDEEEAYAAFVEQMQTFENPNYKKTLWFYFCPTEELYWKWTSRTIQQTCAPIHGQADLIKIFCGEAVPPVELYMTSGKPMLSFGVVPLFLLKAVQLYWLQKLSLYMDRQNWREILYDFLFLRKTWQKDKFQRSQAALEDPELWRKDVILGVGRRIGPFWYPQNINV